MKHTLINIALFTGIVGVMFGMQVIDDHGAEQEVARQELAKQRQQERFERAAQEVCGPNAGYRLTHKQGEVVCTTKRGKPTRMAQL